jgi:hypothetical protein
MNVYNAIYVRETYLFEDKRLRVTKKEKRISAKNINDAFRIAIKEKPKGFYLDGLNQIN